MFKRILYEEWTTVIPIIAFATLFLVFLVTTIRALRLRPSERRHMASLPLDENNSQH